jgi:hypothetical protein
MENKLLLYEIYFGSSMECPNFWLKVKSGTFLYEIWVHPVDEEVSYANVNLQNESQCNENFYLPEQK